MTKDNFVAVLRAAGITEEQMHKLHVEFEKADPAGHQSFLEFLSIPPAEVASIRAWSAKG